MPGESRFRPRRPIHPSCPTDGRLSVPILVTLLLAGSMIPTVVGTSLATTPPAGAGIPDGLASTGSTVPVIPGAAAFQVSGSPQDPEPPPIATGNAFVYPDLYNTVAGQGNATLSEPRPGAALTTTVDFSNVSGRSLGVVGYPELQYGAKPWCSKGPCPSPAMDARLSLPAMVRSLPEVTAVVDYRVESRAGLASGSFDLAYDLWMTRSPNATSASAGDLELMVWLDHQGASIVPGTPITTLLIPTLWSGRWAPLPWQFYLQSAVPADAAGHWTVAYLVLDPPTAAETVGVDLSGMIRSADAALADEYPGTWAPSGGAGLADPNALYLDDIELGSEFRPLGASGPAQFDWTLFDYCFRVSPSTGGTTFPVLTANCSVLPGPASSSAGIGLTPLVAVGGAVVGAAGLGLVVGSRAVKASRTPYR